MNELERYIRSLLRTIADKNEYFLVIHIAEHIVSPPDSRFVLIISLSANEKSWVGYRNIFFEASVSKNRSLTLDIIEWLQSVFADFKNKSSFELEFRFP